MPAALFFFCRRDILHDLFGTAFDAAVDPLDDLKVLALRICAFELRVPEPFDHKGFGPNVYAAAVHADPDEILLRCFEALLAHEDVLPRRDLVVGRLHLEAHRLERDDDVAPGDAGFSASVDAHRPAVDLGLVERVLFVPSNLPPHKGENLPSGAERLALVRLGIRDRFACIRARDDVTLTKPDPELFAEALACLGVAPDEALAYEDSVHGLVSAKAAGVRCVVVPGPLTRDSDFSAADAVLDSLAAEEPVALWRRLHLM